MHGRSAAKTKKTIICLTTCVNHQTTCLPQRWKGFVRLQKQALSEIDVFNEMGLRELLDDDLASHDALVSRLNDMFLDHLKTTYEADAPPEDKDTLCQAS